MTANEMEKKNALKKEILKGREFYLIKSLMGYFPLYCFAFLIGGRMAGKSYAVTESYVKMAIEDGTPFYWCRLTEKQTTKLLRNNAETLIDPDIRRKYNLDIVTIGNNVYNVTKRAPKDKHGKEKILEKKLICRVMCLSTFYADKGNGFFDKDYTGWYNIALDEMQPEKGERRTFDIMYSFVNQIENIIRNRKTKVRVIGICNLLEEASDILAAFEFLPEEFGRYKLIKNKKILTEYLKKLEMAEGNAKMTREVNDAYQKYDFGKRCLIEYIEPSDAYKSMRSHSLAETLMGQASTFSNKQIIDKTLVYGGRLTSPQYIIKFSKDSNDWFTVWNNSVVCRYNNEHKPVMAMKPYLDEVFTADVQKNIITLFDNRAFKYKNLITFKLFQKNINLLKPRGN